jgi:hypothetical protein
MRAEQISQPDQREPARRTSGTYDPALSPASGARAQSPCRWTASERPPWRLSQLAVRGMRKANDRLALVLGKGREEPMRQLSEAWRAVEHREKKSRRGARMRRPRLPPTRAPFAASASASAPSVHAGRYVRACPRSIARPPCRRARATRDHRGRYRSRRGQNGRAAAQD